ncbi:MAG TPA: trypsin-like serine protease [Myxococcaceae bacterium]
MKTHIFIIPLGLLCWVGAGCPSASQREVAGPRLGSDRVPPGEARSSLQDDRQAFVETDDSYYRMSSTEVAPPFSEIQYVVINGQRDSRNSYESAVKVEFSEDGKDFCSGVLLNPYLVLSAAHCFCVKAPLTIAITIDRQSTRCDMRVNAVKAFVFRPDKGKKQLGAGGGAGGEKQANSPAGKFEPLISKGKMEIEIHPDYKSVYDSYGNLKESQADLVAIHLTEPIVSGAKPFRVPTKKGRDADNGREVEVGEVLEVVGYGRTEPKGGDGLIGQRYYGSNIVKTLSSGTKPQERDAKTKDGVFMFRGEGPDGRQAHAASGDSGGPCFAQRDNEAWLVGIISGGAHNPGSLPVSLFTSTYVHRKWIDEQRTKSRERIKKLKRKSN